MKIYIWKSCRYDDFSGENFPIEATASVIDVAERIGLENQDEYFVVLNDEHLPIGEWKSHPLRTGNKLVFCPLLKGG